MTFDTKVILVVTFLFAALCGWLAFQPARRVCKKCGRDGRESPLFPDYFFCECGHKWVVR